MAKFKGDYMGFTYNGVHSSELGIVRVSDGSRFNENLLPTMQDKTVQVPGGDGTYYFGSYYTQKPFSVSFAFDALTEDDLAELKRHFGDRGVHDLIFDETPYKIWSAKVTGTATIKYLPFDEGSTHRLYKGEGSIQFTCYRPFARCAFSSKEISSENFSKDNLSATYPNINEWWDAARIESGVNFGDMPVPFKIELKEEDNLSINGNSVLYWNIPDSKTVTLDTKIGIAKDEVGEIYNEYIIGDLTTKIPVGATVPEGVEFTCLYI